MMFRHLTMIACFLVLDTHHLNAASLSQWRCQEECTYLNPVLPRGKYGDMMLGFDVIYWQICQSDLDYALEGEDPVSSASTFGKRYSLEGEFRFGFKGHANYQFGCDGWAIQGDYIYFHPTTHKNLSTIGDPDNKLLALNFGGSLISDFFNTIRSESKNKYDQLDVLFSQSSRINRSFILTHYFGARGMWYDQALKFTGETDGLSEVEVTYEASVSSGGLHAGLISEMWLCGCLSLSGDFGGSIVVGRTNSLFRVIEDPENTALSTAIISDAKWNCFPSMDLSVALRSEGVCGYYALRGYLNYDMTYWWNVPTIRRYPLVAESDSGSSTTVGKMLLHGVTLGFNVFF